MSQTAIWSLPIAWSVALLGSWGPMFVELAGRVEDRAFERTAPDHPEMHIQETYQPHDGEKLIPKGDWDGYRDLVDQGGPKVLALWQGPSPSGGNDMPCSTPHCGTGPWR